MDELNFQVGQMISYGRNGICTIEEIREVQITPDADPEPYYVLSLLKDEQSTIMVPVNNEKLINRMKEVMTEEEVHELIDAAAEDELEWEDNRRQRDLMFKEILMEGTSVDLLRMIICLFERQKKLIGQRKKLSDMDHKTLRAAVRLLDEEISIALDIDEDEVSPLMADKLGVDEHPL